MPHSITHGDACCFAYFNKIWDIPGCAVALHLPAKISQAMRCDRIAMQPQSGTSRRLDATKGCTAHSSIPDPQSPRCP
jgi:hypothetical protein